MNLANGQPFSHKSNAGQVGSQWGDALPRKALLASSHTVLGCAFQFPLFRHLTRAGKEWEARGGGGTTVLDSLEDRATHGTHPSIPRCYLVNKQTFSSRKMVSFVFSLVPQSCSHSQGHSGSWPRKTSSYYQTGKKSVALSPKLRC